MSQAKQHTVREDEWFLRILIPPLGPWGLVSVEQLKAIYERRFINACRAARFVEPLGPFRLMEIWFP